MLKVQSLSGAQLDYWVARAEGIPAEQLRIRQVQRSTEYHVVRYVKDCTTPTRWASDRAFVLPYSSEWMLGGPLIEKHGIAVDSTFALWAADLGEVTASGDTPLQAICRAVVRAAFGDEVEEVAICG